VSFEFRLPDIGEGIAEGEITQWHVEVGQEVREDDPFVEVMTDKATVEIPAPHAGVIQELRVPAGQAVPVGEVIAVIATSGEAPAAPAAAKSEPSAAPAPVSAVAAAAPVAASVQAEPVAPVAAGNGSPAAATRKVLASPAVRRRAREQGVDLSVVSGTGPAGRVTREDFARFVQEGTPAGAPVSVPAAAPAVPRPAASPILAPSGGETRIPLRGIRKRIADRMQQSKQTAAHFTYVDELDCTELVAAREALKPLAAEQGVKLTYMPFLVKAVTTAMPRFPMLNASLDEASQEIVQKLDYNIGFAADTEAGLMVPVVHGAAHKSLLRLGADIQDLAVRAREGKLSLEEVTGSTFTITNAGNIGGLFATPVINYPEVAILGVHKMEDRAVVRDGEVVIRRMMHLSLSLDHRVVDGAVGARFMNELLRLLEDPRQLLLGTL
jgi:pyruvate dehydrogenase E2 component (dihydrolipoamide acetyltransferase)